ncbi:hypothetical protein PV326_005077 [Microctonus aethiopoides]|nr:hypothetical protein PV326_005077 [Microctonus aethiopoides]
MFQQLHSEYRSTYTWHEYTGPHQEHTVVRRAPQAPQNSTKQASAKLQSAKSTEDENNEGPTLEPPLPRRKKCPELAYRHHEFINATDSLGIDAVDTNVVADKVREVTANAVLPPSQLSKAISRISTEYRLQFAWPRRAQLTNGDTVAPLPAAGGAGGTAGGPPRKSLSMGALKQGVGPCGPAPVHMKKRPGDVDHKRDGVQASELEPLVGNNVDNIDGVVHETEERDEDLNELKITFRERKSAGKGVRIVDSGFTREKNNKAYMRNKAFPTSEVIELRRLADEYKHRDWGSGLASDEETSLSVTKEEKEKENTRKVAPTMPPAGRPSSVQARPIYGILQDDIKADNEKAIAHARKEFLIRHHLDRTTGIGDGALLPSPTREKLEPVVPRRRDDSKEIRDEIQPRPKSSPKNSPRTGRSQSLGPLSRSPKRQTPRTPSVNKDAKEKEKEHKDKEARDRSGEPERHPRPTGVSATGGRVRWNIREPSHTSKSPAISSSTCEPPIPPLPPPPSGPGPTSLHRRLSPRPHRKPFLATTAPLHRPLHHHAKPSSTNVSNTSAVKAPLVKNTIHQSVVDGSGPGGSGPFTARSARSASPAIAAAATSGSKSERLNKPNNAQNRARGAARAKATSASADPSKSSFDNRNQSYRANAVLRATYISTSRASKLACNPTRFRPKQLPNNYEMLVIPVTAEPQMNGGDTTGGDSSIASTPLSHSATVSAPAATAVISNYPWFDDEPVVKSPPEPTRVKSPEQMIMRSPEPVNWTVPLDTGKTFTVTQNVREGEPLTRPHSEAKTWAATSSIHSTPQSAPPELAALHKSHHHSQQSGYKSPESESISLGSYTGLNGHKDLDSERDSPLPTNVQGITPTKSDKDSIAEEVEGTKVESSKDTSIKPITGTNLRCLDDPTFEYDKGQKDNSTVPTTITMVTGATAPVGTTAQTTGYRVLEAEDPVIPPISGSSTTSTGGSGYHVLEAPALSPGSAQRSVASDVLEKARNRFDKFWGKGNSDNQA